LRLSDPHILCCFRRSDCCFLCSRSYASLGLKKVSPERGEERWLWLQSHTAFATISTRTTLRLGCDRHNIITTVVGRHYRPGACNRGVCSRKRPFGVHSGDNNEGDRKLHSTVCGNRLHTMYRRNIKSSVGILT
jgi:hypothetical protein